MSKVPDDETVHASVVTEHDVLGEGRLVCTDSHLVFRGETSESVVVAIDRIDAVAFHTGAGLTDRSQVGAGVALLGLGIAVVSVVLSESTVVLAALGLVIAAVGSVIAATYYDRTTGLRVHAGAQTWVFVGGQLRDVPDTVRTVAR